MTIKTTKNDPNNRSCDELNEQLRSLWLGWRDSNPANLNRLSYQLLAIIVSK